MNDTNYEVPHCGAFSTRHSHLSWIQIFISGSCFQIPSLNVRDNASQPYNTTGNVIVLYCFSYNKNKGWRNRHADYTSQMNWLDKWTWGQQSFGRPWSSMIYCSQQHWQVAEGKDTLRELGLTQDNEKALIVWRCASWRQEMASFVTRGCIPVRLVEHS